MADPSTTPSDPPLRWGICGTGAIAARFVEAIGSVPDAEVVAVGSRTPGRAAAFAEAHGIGRAHDGQGALAADDEVDVVYVATTADDHRAAVLTCLAAGRHVLCEKPLATTPDEVEAMLAAAAHHERFLMEALWSRFLPAYLRLGEVLAAGRIGEVRTLEADFAFRLPDAATGHRLLDPARGGGALLDLGVYPLNLALLVLGQHDRVAAVGTVGPTGADEQVAIVLGYPSGATARLYAAVRVGGTNTARIVGDEGVVVVEAMAHAPARLRVEVGGDVEVLDCGPPSLAHQVPAVHEAIRAGRLQCPAMPWDASRSLARTLDEVRRQVHGGG